VFQQRLNHNVTAIPIASVLDQVQLHYDAHCNCCLLIICYLSVLSMCQTLQRDFKDKTAAMVVTKCIDSSVSA